MPLCAALNCSNRTKKYFYRFPLDPIVRKKWEVSLKRENFRANENHRICEDHFEDHCFEKNKEEARKAGYKKVGLIPGACPTIFIYKPSVKKPPRKSLAVVKRKNLELLVNQGQQAEFSDHRSEEETDVCEGETATNMKSVSTQTCDEIKISSSTQTHAELRVKSTQTKAAIKCQTVQTDSVATQEQGCDPLFPDDNKMEIEEEDYENISEVSNGDTDPDWTMEESDADCDSDEEGQAQFEELKKNKLPQEQRKFLIFESALVELFETCPECFSQCTVTLKNVIGSSVTIDQECKNGHKRTWCSQPSSGKMPFGNLMLAATIFFTGSSPQKAVNMMKFLKMPTLSLNTYHRIQSAYLIPSIHLYWSLQQQELLETRRGSANISIGGDARCCSPGHTAKYGSYTLMDLDTNEVLTMQLVQSNEVKNSCAMELEGLKRCLGELEIQDIDIASITTDRHPQVQKFLRLYRPLYDHRYDCWHVAKGVEKKVIAVSRKHKSCANLKDWAHSISNHLYWCAATSGGNGDVAVARWTSIMNHIANIHEGHSDLFPACLHDEIIDNKKEWLKTGSKAYKELQDIVCNARILKDVRKLSSTEQTSSLEAYHKLVTYFAPKSTHYSYMAMEARTLLAVLHNNENANREQSCTKDGKAVYTVSYPKAKKGGAVVKEVKVPCTYSYVEDLIEQTMALRVAYPSYQTARDSRNYYIPPPVCQQYDHTDRQLDKTVLVQRQISRFNKK